VKSKDEIPAELVNPYVERDGAWLLDVDVGTTGSHSTEKKSDENHRFHFTFRGSMVSRFQSAGLNAAWVGSAVG